MAKYCPKCRNLLEENSKKCKNCGIKIGADTDNNENKENIQQEKKANNFGVIGFIISIISFFTFGLTTVFGLILSIIGIIDGKKKKQNYGFGIAGLVISSIIILILIISELEAVINAKDVIVIDFSNIPYSEADDYCEKLSLKCAISKEYSASIAEGKLIKQSIEPLKMIKSYQTINLVYSKGLNNGSSSKKESNESKTKKKSKSTNKKSTSETNNLSVISNQKLRENFKKACKEINMDITKISNLQKKDDWNSGPRYTFNYKGEIFILYALDNGDVSSITIASGLEKIYLDGYNPLNVDDFIFSTDAMTTLRVMAEEKLKSYIKYPSTAKFKWNEYSYTRKYDIYQITGTVKAKNAMGVEIENKFVIEYKIVDGNYTVVFLKVNNENYIGSESQMKEIPRTEVQTQTSQQDNSIILKDGSLGEYGRKDIFDGDEYIRYYIPSGTYKVEALTKNASFYIETIEIHKEDGWDTATTIRTVRIANSGDTDEITIEDGQCISLVIYTQVKLTKIN